MKFSLVSGAELSREHRSIWLDLQSNNPHLVSPYFCPEFTLAVASVRDDVMITILEEGGRVVGFFPFQRGRFGAGRPVGGNLSDYHGVIAREDAMFDIDDLLRESRLGLWSFDHLLAGQAPFARYHHVEAVSPALDLSGGYAAYRKRLRDAGRGRITQFERKARKLGRDVGPLRFEAHTTDRRILSQLFAWKSEQCKRTGGADFFSLSWTRALVERILAIREPHFAGELSALFAGDHLVAAHLGMRSSRAWHWWFPVYDHAFGQHSPGGLLLLQLAQEAAAQGAQMLDLGKGDDSYKASFADLEIPLAEGCAVRPSLAASLRFARETTEQLLRSTAAEPLRPALRRLNQWVQRYSYA
jgi:CelD/BcsL family acetyltransferase involved in cellulose biosynthesis